MANTMSQEFPDPTNPIFNPYVQSRLFSCVKGLSLEGWICSLGDQGTPMHCSQGPADLTGFPMLYLCAGNVHNSGEFLRSTACGETTPTLGSC
jgi:hypothetical protein